jgi:hypothetical protein
MGGCFCAGVASARIMRTPVNVQLEGYGLGFEYGSEATTSSVLASCTSGSRLLWVMDVCTPESGATEESGRKRWTVLCISAWDSKSPDRQFQSMIVGIT